MKKAFGKNKSRARKSAPGILDLDDAVIGSGLDRTTIKRFLNLVFQEPKWLLLGFSLVLLSTACAIAGPRIFGYAIDEVLVAGKKEKLLSFAFAYFLVELIRVFAISGNQLAFSWLGQRVIQKLRLDAFSKLQMLPLSVFSKVPTGKLVTRVTNDAMSVADVFTAGFITIIGNFLVITGILIWLVVLDWRLGLLVLSVFPFLIGASVYFSRKLKLAYRSARTRLSSLNAFLSENILGMRVVQIFNRSGRQLERFRRLNEWYAEAQFLSVRVYALYQPTITLCTGVALALAIAFGGEAVTEGRIPLGTLVAFFAYVLALFQPVLEIADRWNVFLAGMTSAERLFAIVDAEPEDDLDAVDLPLPPRAELPKLRGRFKFEQVSFSYEPGTPVFRNLSFEVEEGTYVGIVGPTGSGKSSLLQLLLRFYDPQSGRIFVDGIPLAGISKRKLRDRIGLVQQEVFLFSGSLRENLFLWREKDPDLERRILEFAGNSRFAELLSKLDEPLQERGQNLSFGERQLVSFLRTWAGEPDVWLLDEATSSMDAETEQDLGRLLRAASRGKTTFVIAHRLATVRDADRILVLSQGEIVEDGNHEDLMKKGGLYSRLWRLQSREENSEARA